MSSNSQRFATLVIAAFDDRTLTTDELVKQAGGPSNTYMTNLRKAAKGEVEMKEPRSDTYGRIERAANWKKGTARLVWRGDEPDVIPPVDADHPLSRYAKPEMPPRRRFSGGIDGYVERIADRLIDLEERVELLEQRLQEGGGDDGEATSAENRKPAPGPDDQPGTRGQLRGLPTAANKTKDEPSVSKRRRRQDESAEASQDDGDFDPR